MSGATPSAALLYRADFRPTDGSREELRRWAVEQVDRGRPEQAIAEGLGWTVDDVRHAISERLVRQ
jgi:hypothetical protein